ncbi:NADH:flavin oxidoreductase [Sneathiella sp.]|uniref:NADH:flavin oxidoreductase n=1 Tax=Sneathiella sp. TaxID=1964365 RepID=UPI0039E36716
MPRKLDKLFSPFSSPKLSLPNRLVMAPMTRFFSPDGVPGQNVADYYRRRVEGGTGLIITEGTVVNDPVASPHPNVPHFYGEKALAGWENVVKAVHGAGGKIMPQIWHVGMARRANEAPNPELPNASPSGILHNEKKIAEPLTEDEIGFLVKAYADAATAAKNIGFDGVEIHGAHGYLIDQFFWEQMNRREDGYGGDQVKRTSFAARIVAAIRAATGEDYPIVFRFSQWKQQDYSARLAESPEELAAFLKPLVEAGVDIFHCSTRRYWEPEFEGSPLNLAGWTKKLTGLPTITVGSVGLSKDMMSSFKGEDSGTRSIEDLGDRLETDEFDLVAVGRALIQDPEWPKKVREGRMDELEDYSAKSLAELV